MVLLVLCHCEAWTRAVAGASLHGGDLVISSRRWIVSQIGAREHYAVARGLHRENALDFLMTDFWCRRGRSILSRLPGPFRSLAARWDRDIPRDRVRSFNFQALSIAIAERLTREDDLSLRYVKAGEAFGAASARIIERQRRNLSPAASAFFGYCTGALEPLELLSGMAIPTVVGQIQPGRREEEIVEEERAKWPGWEPSRRSSAPEYWRRIEAEWAAAGIVVVNSLWSLNALVAQGVPKEKIRVIPLAYEGESPPPAARPLRDELSVLWLGNICLRKGIQYLFEAARLLQDENISFAIAGPLQISADAAATAPRNVTFLGRVTRDRLSSVYRQADLFVLPTLSDGFAITQLEAMAHGLPVIATPCCGEVVRHEIDGLLVSSRDSAALAGAILRLKRDRSELTQMSERAVRRAAEFSLSRYASALVDAVETVTA